MNYISRFGFGLVLVWFWFGFYPKLPKSWLVWFAFSKATNPNHLEIHKMRPNL